MKVKHFQRDCGWALRMGMRLMNPIANAFAHADGDPQCWCECGSSMNRPFSHSSYAMKFFMILLRWGKVMKAE